jgi:hypothetical protein
MIMRAGRRLGLRGLEGLGEGWRLGLEGSDWRLGLGELDWRAGAPGVGLAAGLGGLELGDRTWLGLGGWGSEGRTLLG